MPLHPCLRLPLFMLLACATLQVAAAPAECAALQSEVETLRTKVKVLDAAQSPASTTLPSAAPALPGTAAKPLAVQTVVIEEPYSHTGCSRGLFKGIESAAWQDGSLWLDLEKGQSPAAVEKLLGVEHYDEHGGRNVVWHYGRCGKSSLAQLLFTDGKLADWRAPAN